MATIEQDLTLRAVSVGSSENLLDDWKTWLEVEKNLAPNTIKLYTRTLEVLTTDLGDPAHLTTEALRTWLHVKRGASGTVSNRISALTSFYKYLVRTDVRPDNPCDKLDRPKSGKGLPRPIVDIPRALAELDAADERANFKGSIPRRVGETRDMAVFLIETGLRIHEAVNLNESVPAGPTLRLRGKGRKDAIIPLTPRAREALDRLGGRWPVGARATQRRFERADFSPHMCRHTRGTTMAEAGKDLGDIQAMLRHASPATTLIYSAWSTERVAKALEGIDY